MIARFPDQVRRVSGLARIITLIVVACPLLAFLHAIHQLWNHEVNARDLVLYGSFYLLTALGIGVGFHRLLRHRSFSAALAIRGCFPVLGFLAVEGAVVTWVATHLEHHAHSDRPGDPHSPRDSVWHAHIGWMIGPFTAAPETYARHLQGDRLVPLMPRTFCGWVAMSLALPALLDGWLSAGSLGGVGTAFWHGLLWGGLVRVCLTHHVTWSVNSILPHHWAAAIRRDP
jgi:stearoyl-CoA desaturase (delta-9 desaturase)